MKKIILVLVLIFTFHNAHSQDDNVEIIMHRVALGETMLIIAKKYLVQPSEIYKLNKKAIDGISEGMDLYIPQPIKSQDIITKKKEKIEKEALALLELKKESEEIAVAQAETKEEEDTLTVADTASTSIDDFTMVKHKVGPKETLYSISKKYGVSVDEIKNQNESILTKGLLLGQELSIKLKK